MLYQFLRSIPLLGRVVARLGNWHYHWDVHPTTRFRRILRGRKEVSIVVIGANDGKTLDPLYPLLKRNRSWKALFIEPVPYLFARLKANYGSNPRFQFEQVAIADKPQTLPFYYVSEEAGRQVSKTRRILFEQIGSFSRAKVEEHSQGYEQYIVEVPLEAVPLATVLERRHVEKIDLLLIDCEGYDWDVLKQFDVQRYKPLIIFFEHKHLPAEIKAACREFLRDYDITDLGYDFLCRRRE